MISLGFDDVAPLEKNEDNEETVKTRGFSMFFIIPSLASQKSRVSAFASSHSSSSSSSSCSISWSSLTQTNAHNLTLHHNIPEMIRILFLVG